MSKVFKTAKLSIKYDCGLNEHGKTIMRSKSYSDVREGTSDINIRTVVNGINSLVSNTDSEFETLLVTSEHCL